jgi:hypothetical protein
MPQLKDTLLSMIVEHIGNDISYEFNSTRGIIRFPNGSKIIAFSWADKQYRKVRSYNISSAFIEELTENDDDEFYKEIKMRCGRIAHVKENMIICATNPSSPSHWAYKYFILSKLENRKTFYSLTEDNPYLPATYIQNIKETLTDKEVRRMLYGEWIEIKADQIYYNYDPSRNFINEVYTPKQHLPFDVSFDFNISDNKPLSCLVSQYDGKFHVFSESHIFSARTADVIEDLHSRDIFKNAHTIRIFGDASGKNRDTRSLGSDYDIIIKTLSNLYPTKRIEYLVPKANPPIRRRHNTVNGAFMNSLGHIRLYLYKGTEWIDEGLRLTKAKSGGNFVEDDSLPQQHVTTALGYMVDYVLNLMENRKSSQIQL